MQKSTDPALDPLQFAYRANQSMEDAVNMALHYVLNHLDTAGNYARILFVDFSSAFNTILPSTLDPQLFLPSFNGPSLSQSSLTPSSPGSPRQMPRTRPSCSG